MLYDGFLHQTRAAFVGYCSGDTNGLSVILGLVAAGLFLLAIKAVHRLRARHASTRSRTEVSIASFERSPYAQHH